MKLIEEVMTREPFFVDSSSPLHVAHQTMVERGFRHVPVIGDGQIKGLLSDRDIHLAMLAHAGLDDVDQLTVNDVYDLAAYVVSSDTSVKEVAATMAERHIGAVLVEDAGRLLGILTATDVCRLYAQQD